MKNNLQIIALLIGSTLLTSSVVFAQNVGINATGAAPDASAMLDIVSANRGLLVPRVALTATNAAGPITAPTTSLLVFNTATVADVTPGYYYWDGAEWVRLSTGAVGPMGPAGPAGPQGPIGLTGATGAIGPIGPQGPIGNTGPIGPQGIQGVQGIQGPVGPMGPSWTLSSLTYNADGTMTVNGTAGSGGPISSTNASWITLGNSGTSPATNFVGTTDAQDLQFRTNNVNRMRIMNSTYPTVGIGTTGPVVNLSGNSAVLHVHDGGASVGSQLILSTHATANASRVGIINFAATQATNNRVAASIESNLTAASATNITADLRFFTNNNNTLAEKMRIEADGDVGIGTTTPAEKLHVIGNVRSSTLAGVGVRLVASDANGTLNNFANGTNGQVLSITAGVPTWSTLNSWNTNGNAGTVAATNFVGTTDNIALTFRTNNLERLRLSNTSYQVLAMNNGSVTNPFYSWSTDTDMGLYRQGANTLGFVTGGVEIFRIPEPTFPQVFAMLNGTAARPFYSWSGDPDIGMYRVNTNILGFSTTGTERMRISATGYVGINQNTPLAQTHITTALTTGPALYSHITPTNSLWSGAEFANTNTAGGSGVFATGYSAVEGQTTNFALGWGGYFNGDVNTTGGYFNISDQRLKENIKPINNVLENFKKLNVYSYNYKTGNLGLDSATLRYGFMAQELMKIYPEMVKEKSFNSSNSLTNTNQSDSVKFLAVSYTELVPLTIIAIQEQQAIIEDLLKRIELLELELKNK